MRMRIEISQDTRKVTVLISLGFKWMLTTIFLRGEAADFQRKKGVDPMMDPI
jgi:hypothetical protein